MPTFKITTDAGHGPDDLDSVDFPDAKTASEDAQIALAEMARDHLPNGKRADFGVEIRDEAGKPVYRARLNFHAETEEDLE